MEISGSDESTPLHPLTVLPVRDITPTILEPRWTGRWAAMPACRSDIRPTCKALTTPPAQDVERARNIRFLSHFNGMRDLLCCISRIGQSELASAHSGLGENQPCTKASSA